MEIFFANVEKEISLHYFTKTSESNLIRIILNQFDLSFFINGGVAAKLGRDVVLVRAYSVPPPAGAEFAYYPADWATQLEEAAATYLAEVALPGEKPFVVHGPAAQAVVDVSENVDASLVVMASGGKGLAKRIALGSTTDRVLHSLHRPLLILPPAHD